MQYVACMQLSQLEKADFTSATCPSRSMRRSSAGRKLATSTSTKPSRKLLLIATPTATILTTAARRLIPLFLLLDQTGASLGGESGTAKTNVGLVSSRGETVAKGLGGMSREQNVSNVNEHYTSILERSGVVLRV